MSDNIQTPSGDEDVGLIAYMFTNNAVQAPVLQSLLDMFYRGCYDNTIGLMSARNDVTGKEETLIVGVEHVGEDTLTYPLARLLDPDEVKNYSSPDGKGGWLEKVEQDGSEI